MRNGSKGIFCASSNDTGSVNANSTAAASQAARGMGDVYPVPHRVLARTNTASSVPLAPKPSSAIDITM